MKHALIRTDGPASTLPSMGPLQYSSLERITATDSIIENYNLSQKRVFWQKKVSPPFYSEVDAFHFIELY